MEKETSRTSSKKQSSWKDTLVSVLAFAGGYAGIVERIRDEIHERIKHLVSEILQSVVVVFLLLVGLVFVLVGFVKMLPMLIGIDEGEAYVLTGIVILLASLLMRVATSHKR